MDNYYRFFRNTNNNVGEPTTFTFCNFEVKGVFPKNNNNRNALSWVRNCLVHALNNCDRLPMLITVVLDDDIIKMLHNIYEAISVNVGTLLNWLANEFHCCIQTYKELLPAKAKRVEMPHILWIAALYHKNFSDFNNERCFKANKCLKSIVDLYPEMSFLKLVKIWDPEDSNLYLREQGRFTPVGLGRYWLAVDSAIRYWCMAIKPKINHQITAANGNSSSKFNSKPRNQNRYKWSRHSCKQ